MVSPPSVVSIANVDGQPSACMSMKRSGYEDATTQCEALTFGPHEEAALSHYDVARLNG